MIQFNYSLTEKENKKIYLQVMTLSYMKIYFVVLALGVLFTGLLGLIFPNSSFGTTSKSLFVTFIPTQLLCLGLSLFIAHLDYKKSVKANPETLQGNFRIRFDKSGIIWQINGKNNKISYKNYVIRKGFNNTIVISNPEHNNIIIPANSITKQQYKKIKEYIRG